jgi:pyridoxamine 5'-phosphate oxidase family protein
MEVFTRAELAYLRGERRLARLATVGSDGTPHITPVGVGLGAEGRVIEIGGVDLARTKKFRDIARTGRAALVVDDVLPPWRPRGIEIRGAAEAVQDPQPVIRIYPERVVTWGLDGPESRSVRTIARR